jgi:hypothetical protein
VILWDDKNKEHIIRMAGAEKVRVTGNDFPASTSIATDETTVKAKMDLIVNQEGYHSFCHIRSKRTAISPTAPLDYALWVGSVSITPRKSWWDRPIQPATEKLKREI